ncbi:hypothetical protein P4C99_13985 [Pontiellaceae bacterium B1224]|nr:hypothetical protein [Pontiellaceae bacterium B1224]
MNTIDKCLVAKDSEILQIPYQDYVSLMEKVKQGRRMRLVKDSVVVNLQGFLGGKSYAAEASAKDAAGKADLKEEAAPAEEVKAETPVVESTKPTEEPVQPVAKASAANGRSLPKGVEVPPIKKDIAAHFNKLDESGRLFSVFKQYYTCLNDACGGTVRVTMKDGFCSLWNYDEWEEFSFIDIFEGQLRIALDPRYTAALQSLNLCEVPRLLSSRRNLVCVQVDGLNNTMLNVLVKAFEEVGLTAS